MAYIQVRDIGEYGCNAQLLSCTPESTIRYVQWSVNGSSKGTTTIEPWYSSSDTNLVSGLSPSTNYTLVAKVYRNYVSNNTLIATFYEDFRTASPADRTPPTINDPRYDFPSHGCTNSSTITFHVGVYDYGSGLKSVYMQFNGVGQTWNYAGNGDYSKSFNTPPTPGKYTLGVSAVDGNNNKSERYFEYYITYDTLPPNITAYSAELATGSYGLGITVSAQASDNISGVATYFYRISTKNNSSAWGPWVDIPASSQPKHTFTADGYGYSIEAGGTYYIEYKACDRAGNYIQNPTRYPYYVQYSKPAPWYWSQSEMDALSKHGPISTLTKARWNAFVARVKEFDKWKNGADAGKYYLDDAEIPSKKDPSLFLTAYRFNTVRHAIGSMHPNGSGIKPEVIMTDKPVKGEYFTTLNDRLNSIT